MRIMPIIVLALFFVPAVQKHAEAEEQKSDSYRFSGVWCMQIAYAIQFGSKRLRYPRADPRNIVHNVNRRSKDKNACFFSDGSTVIQNKPDMETETIKTPDHPGTIHTITVLSAVQMYREHHPLGHVLVRKSYKFWFPIQGYFWKPPPRHGMPPV